LWALIVTHIAPAFSQASSCVLENEELSHKPRLTPRLLGKVKYP